ncbi:hypothetical protein [Lentzea nigeriaca]|uniref:hypothetical protein n=1 Tax=Lentzea nigeriaca TaxID=1128665 RepID=UPI001957625E|nr:hypothetical protein [Lentzea nigeriaca]MBM7862352.1 hypothetical protein [Lentzea nigeriaca]
MLSARRVLARFAATATVLTAVLAGGSGAALAAEARFVPEDTKVSWDGAVATVSFREVDVEVEGGKTVISVKVTAEVNMVCTKGTSVLRVRRFGSALDATEYPIGEDGVVTGTARLRLVLKGAQPPGYKCVTENESVTAALEDFFTGATLVHQT